MTAQHSDEVSHSTTSDVNTRPPASGSIQPGTPRRGRTSILTVNAPKKKQPMTECATVRTSKFWKPTAYRQCTATGTTSRNASRPSQRCTVPVHGGAVTRGTLPYMTSAENS